MWTRQHRGHPARYHVTLELVIVIVGLCASAVAVSMNHRSRPLPSGSGVEVAARATATVSPTDQTVVGPHGEAVAQADVSSLAPETTERPLRVAVLWAADLSPVGTPSALSPERISADLAAAGFDALVLDASSNLAGFDVLVNPYGEAFPSTDSVDAALEAGTAWVNLAGTPFLAPNGHDDTVSPARHGVAGLGVEQAVSTEATELGLALAPSLPVTTTDVRGAAVHALDPADERPLARFTDGEGIDAGPAVTLILRPFRIVAVGHAGDAHPLDRARPAAAALLVDLVRVAASTDPGITSMALERTGGEIVITATGEGQLTGTGTFAAPPPWSPQNPSLEWATVRLFRDGRLVDLLSMPSNAAQVTIDGNQILVNGQPVLVKGMGAAGGTPPGTSAADAAAMRRQDLLGMKEIGCNAVRGWGVLSDWFVNYTAAHGLMVLDSLTFGWVGSVTDAHVVEHERWARFVGARARERHNVLMLSMGNEIMDYNDDNFAPKLNRLTDAARSANGGRTPVTYVASEPELLTNGPWPELDVYMFNNYGFTWPLAADSMGDTLAVEYAIRARSQGRPVVIGEFGVNHTADNLLNLVVDGAGAVPDALAARVIEQKWQGMTARGVGGFAFMWADNHDKKDFALPYWRELFGSIEYPPGSGHSPINVEEYWGFHDEHRNPRQTYWALRALYQQGG